MRSNYLVSLIVTAALAVAISLPPGGALAAPAGGSPVDIHLTSYTEAGPPSGAFTATAPLCATGTFTAESNLWTKLTLTCADGTGTFVISQNGSATPLKWRFTGGTGVYAGIKGDGVVVSRGCTPGTAICDAYLSGTVSL
jgi:hypothetical protein